MPFLLCAAVLCGAGLGCNREQEEISQYDVPKESAVYEENHVGDAKPRHGGDEAVDAKPLRKQRMLAAIVVAPAKFWFFKILGPNADVNAVTRDFAAFIATVSFPSSSLGTSGKPTWKLPQGWRQLPDDDPRNAPQSQFAFRRAATILVDPKNDDLELAVSSLKNPGPEQTEHFILINVNRWRDEMGLGERTPENLYDKPNDGNTETVDEVLTHTVNGRKVVYVQFVGFPKPRRPGVGPFMGR